MDNELEALRTELANIGSEFNQKINQLQLRIERLEKEKHSQVFQSESSKSTQQNAVSHEPTVAMHSSDNAVVDNVAVSQTLQTPPIDNDLWQNKKPRKSLLVLLSPFLGPLAGFLEQFLNLYHHYRKQGKAPVFFMTITGIVTLVFGFGYLMQYSFSEYLGPVGKISLGFAVAISITIGGVRFCQKRTDMAEYGSSLVALGVILNYLCAYFAGPYYGLLPALPGFLLLVVVSAAAYGLAVVFETRVVAIVTLVGGASMPIVMNHVDQSPLLYLCYLLVLVAGMLHLALRIRWSQLAYVAMLLSALMVEYSIANRAIDSVLPVGLLVVIHGFFYLFGFYALRGLHPGESMTRSKLILITANILFYLLVSQQLLSHMNGLGAMYLVNALVWGGLFSFAEKWFKYERLSDEFRTVQAMSLLHAGLLAGVGILVLSTPEMMGLIWSLEGLLLVYLGSRFAFASVRVEGYFALLLSFFTMGYQVSIWVADGVVALPDLLSISVSFGWANLVALTVLMYLAVTLLDKYCPELSKNEKRICTVLNCLLAVLLSLSFLLSIGIIWPQGMWLLCLVPMFGLIIYAQKKSLLFVELLGLSHYLLLLVPLAISASLAGSFRFSEQSLYGQVARVEAFLCLWLIAA